ncbi:hypothetical protein HY641_02005 [Candidatus Woesearchaeota archaeon]|nr:hypothetical protein [Candidatus Woesearchaeota archaeon]
MMLRPIMFIIAIANLFALTTMVHLKKTNWATSLAIIEIVLVYLGITLPD